MSARLRKTCSEKLRGPEPRARPPATSTCAPTDTLRAPSPGPQEMSVSRSARPRVTAQRNPLAGPWGYEILRGRGTLPKAGLAPVPVEGAATAGMDRESEPNEDSEDSDHSDRSVLSQAKADSEPGGLSHSLPPFPRSFRIGCRPAAPDSAAFVRSAKRTCQTQPAGSVSDNERTGGRNSKQESAASFLRQRRVERQCCAERRSEIEGVLERLI
jgi:hypothetical protein